MTSEDLDGLVLNFPTPCNPFDHNTDGIDKEDETSNVSDNKKKQLEAQENNNSGESIKQTTTALILHVSANKRMPRNEVHTKGNNKDENNKDDNENEVEDEENELDDDEKVQSEAEDNNNSGEDNNNSGERIKQPTTADDDEDDNANDVNNDEFEYNKQVQLEADDNTAGDYNEDEDEIPNITGNKRKSSQETDEDFVDLPGKKRKSHKTPILFTTGLGFSANNQSQLKSLIESARSKKDFSLAFEPDPSLFCLVYRWAHKPPYQGL
jgi:hypothetical protein